MTRQTLILEQGNNDRQHRQRLEQLLSNATGVIRVASAYVTERHFLTSSNRERRLLVSLRSMDIASGATSIESLRAMIESGVKCRFLPDRPSFHSKVYIFGTANAVVTSANLTNNAFDSNIEVGAELQGNEVTELITWYDRLWKLAEPLTIEKLAALHRETAALRKEFEKLRKKSKGKLPIPPVPNAAGKLSDSLIHLFENAKRFFACNTDRKHAKRTSTGGFELEERMHSLGFAAAWEDFKFPSHMEMVRKGDAIFMFAKGVGIVGIGVALEKCETLQPNDIGRVSDYDTYPEWRVAAKWLTWVDDAVAYPYKSPNFTFWNITEPQYDGLREGVKDHFIGDTDVT